MWADANPHAVLPSHHQQCFYINVWAGICADNLFGPHILANRLTGQNYKAFMENNMPDFLADMPLIICRESHLMHDGAPTYFSLVCLQVPESKISWFVDG
jgi:hypothetical protein